MPKLFNVLSLLALVTGLLALASPASAEFFGCNDAKLKPGHVLYSSIETPRSYRAAGRHDYSEAYASQPSRHHSRYSTVRYFRAGSHVSDNSQW